MDGSRCGTTGSSRRFAFAVGSRGRDRRAAGRSVRGGCAWRWCCRWLKPPRALRHRQLHDHTVGAAIGGQLGRSTRFALERVASTLRESTAASRELLSDQACGGQLLRVRRRRPVRSGGGAPSADHVVLLDEVHHLALLAPADGASNGVEAELLLQERPLAEQALVRPVVRRVVGLELLPTTRQQWCSVEQHAVDGKTLKAQPRTGCLVACCRLDLGRRRVRMAGLPRRHRLGDLLERMRGRATCLPLLVEKVA